MSEPSAHVFEPVAMLDSTTSQPCPYGLAWTIQNKSCGLSQTSVDGCNHRLIPGAVSFNPVAPVYDGGVVLAAKPRNLRKALGRALPGDCVIDEPRVTYAALPAWAFDVQH